MQPPSPSPMTTAPERIREAEALAKAKALLSQYIKEHRLRNTLERTALLEQIYSYHTPFSPDDLMQAMEGKVRLSMGTVYNSLALFERLGLVVRVLYGQKTLYEKSRGERFLHFYRFCIHCGKVERASAGRMEAALQELHYTRFSALSLSMCASGICSTCRAALTKTHNQYISEHPGHQAKPKGAGGNA